MNFILNGREMHTDKGKDQIGYDTISQLAGIDPVRLPTVTYRSKNGDGILVCDDRLLLTEGTVINCTVTNNT